VHTTYGPIRGVEVKFKGMEFKAFRGIPFAAPPEGKLRFKVCINISKVYFEKLTIKLNCKTHSLTKRCKRRNQRDNTKYNVFKMGEIFNTICFSHQNLL